MAQEWTWIWQSKPAKRSKPANWRESKYDFRQATLEKKAPYNKNATSFGFLRKSFH
jgi:hypothetical protein